MKEKSIDDIVYLLKKTKQRDNPKPIVFLGAGASVTAGIPTANKIKEQVLNEYSDNPAIKKLSDRETTYYEVMECLPPLERKKILKDLVAEAKINIAHIYLAHLINLGYIDYILTTNFDNLVQRALALYNTFPTTYDISNFKDLTTTNLELRSIVYLHGKYDGLWQLNTPEEMGKIDDIVSPIFNKITNNRSWIVIGYSGSDPIFDQLVNLGRFDNGLFWISYKDEEPSKKVKQKLLNKPNSESYIVTGYDSDSFFLKINAKLGNDEPAILNSPFSFLKEVQQDIVDIKDTQKYKGLNERFKETRMLVEDAINRYELEEESTKLNQNEIKKVQLHKKLVNVLINEKYSKVEALEKEINNEDYEKYKSVLYGIYNNWGLKLSKEALQSPKDSDSLYNKAFKKFKKATEINPDFFAAWNNWASSLGEYLQKTNSKDDTLYKEIFDKFEKATNLNPSEYSSWNDWGNYLSLYADFKENYSEKEKYLKRSFEKFDKATELNPDLPMAWYNWGKALGSLADIKKGETSISFFEKAIEKLDKAVKIKPELYAAWSILGFIHMRIGEIRTSKQSLEYYKKAINGFKKALSLNSSSALDLALLSKTLFKVSALENVPNQEQYKDKSLAYLEKAFQEDKSLVDKILDDKDWSKVISDDDYKSLINKFKT